MKTILVATDFSPAALNAANYAAEMALAINADLYLLHVYQLPVSYGDVPFALSTVDMEQAAEKDMNEFKSHLLSKKGNGMKVRTEVRLGNFYPELETVCYLVKPYVVVIGSQGATAAERFFFGSNAVYTMKHLQWPLITVPQGIKFLAIKKIGLACDFDDVINTTPVDEIKMLVKDFNAQLHVLNTGKEGVFNPELVFESGVLREMFSELNPRLHFIANDDTDEGIIDFAEKNQIDLLVVLPKRHNFLEKFIHKSHSKQLVLHSHVPVMALHSLGG